MCGICGMFDLRDEGRVTVPVLDAMNDTLEHRGPDDAGVWCDPAGRIGLANRRLAIIDLTPAGHQPMCNEDGSVWIAYNGETYNFAQLRETLARQGHQFRSRTDTETLVHLYEEHGDACVHHLRGMFAFALWDARRRRLLLVRDREGIKPLYYTVQDGSLIFGSEIKALLASGRVHPSLNRSALVQYLALGYVAPPDTLFAGIHKLEPGCLLVADESGIQLRRYWDIYQDVVPGNGHPAHEYVEATLAQLEESVRIRLVADVPVGVFLSGGIDSSLIAALAARQSNQQVKTFTLGFRDHPEYNELVYARRVADYLHAEAHEVLIGPEEITAFFPRFLDFQEEPVSNPIWFATYFVSKLARDHGVIVVLSGDGGDELFAGYNRWMEYLRFYDRGWRQFRALPAPMRRVAGGLAQTLLRQGNQRELVRRGIAGEELFWSATVFKPAQLGAMLVRELKLAEGHVWPQLPIARWRAEFAATWESRSTDYVEWMAYASLRGTLLEDYLMRLDKMGMAASIEGRVPFLDHEFIAFSLAIPPALKYSGYRTKHLLREVARRVLPADIVDRRKMGFCAPVEAWLQEALGPRLQAGLILLQAREQIFDPAWFAHALDGIRHKQGLDATHWALLALGQWYTRWIANTTV